MPVTLSTVNTTYACWNTGWAHRLQKDTSYVEAAIYLGKYGRGCTETLKMCIQFWRQNKEVLLKNVSLRSLPRDWPGKNVAMDLCGPLPKTKAGDSFRILFIDYFSRWIELVASKRTVISEIVSALRDVWMPKHVIPFVHLSDNSSQFTASIIRNL